LAACGASPEPATSAAVKVVAGENFWGNIAAHIGGKDSHVTSIVTSPNNDPHLYESSAANAAAVAEANLVIENSAGYDDWLSKLLVGTSHHGRIGPNVEQAPADPPIPPRRSSTGTVEPLLRSSSPHKARACEGRRDVTRPRRNWSGICGWYTPIPVPSPT
jgi:hypothetical protein